MATLDAETLEDCDCEFIFSGVCVFSPLLQNNALFRNGKVSDIVISDESCIGIGILFPFDIGSNFCGKVDFQVKWAYEKQS